MHPAWSGSAAVSSEIQRLTICQSSLSFCCAPFAMTQRLLQSEAKLSYHFQPRLAACLMTLYGFPELVSYQSTALALGNEEVDRPALQSSQARRTRLISFILTHTFSSMCRGSNNHVRLQEDHRDRRHAAAVSTGTLARNPDNQLKASAASRYCIAFANGTVHCINQC